MARPRLLDLFCGAGGIARGYHDAGYEVMGVDIRPQPHYPYRFIQADALVAGAMLGRFFDVIHASPPCQRYTSASLPWMAKGKEYPDYISVTRALVRHLGKPYVIENVPGARDQLENPLMLCGTMFGLMVTRHRLFECDPPIWFAPATCQHWAETAPMGRPAKRGEEFIQVVGHFVSVDYAREAMEIDWMTRNELAQAVPPAYGRYIGAQMRRQVCQ